MILLTMGLNSDYFLDQLFKTQNQFQNDQISLSHSSPRRHTNLRLRSCTCNYDFSTKKTRIVVFLPQRWNAARSPPHSPPRVTQASPAAVALSPPGNGTTHHAPAATPIAQVGPSSARRPDPARAFRNAVSAIVVVVNKKTRGANCGGARGGAHTEPPRRTELPHR